MGKASSLHSKRKFNPTVQKFSPHHQDLLQQGLAHHQRGDLKEAELLYGKALSEEPENFDLLNLLGVVALQRNDVSKGIELLRRAIVIKPDSATAYLNLGNAMRSLKDFDGAIEHYDQAIALKPDYFEAFSNRGVTLEELFRHEDALNSYDCALKIKPDYALALNNRGNALRSLGKHEDALASYCSALKTNPSNAEALNNCGAVLQDLERFEEALACYESALAANPDYAQALCNCGKLLQVLKRNEDAAKCFSRLIEIKPNYAYAIEQKFHSQLRICDWSQYVQTVQLITKIVREGKLTITPGTFLAVSDSAALQLQCARTYISSKHPRSIKPLRTNSANHHDRIRLAYISADFHNHATAYLMAELFELHDKTKFEVTAISFSPNIRSDMQERLVRSFNSFVDVQKMSDYEVAEMMSDMQIDIAVDLKGFTKDSRTGILAYRAAPIQVNYLGYPGTTGADYIDYIIADLHTIPKGHEEFYTEKVVRLPDTYQVNDSKRVIASSTPTRSEADLPETGFIFCSFNNNYKITPSIFEIWMRLLHRIDGSVLWLLEDNTEASRNLKQEACQHGIAPERLVFAPRIELKDHLARHRLADLFLDTLPINAHTTASDALWAGLPVLTCNGNTFAGRVAGSLLNAVGLPELVTHDLEDYEATAVVLAKSPAILTAYKSRLERNRTTQALFNTARFCQNIEKAYIAMYERYQQDLPPENFSITEV